jgi:hypothetical protein
VPDAAVAPDAASAAHDAAAPDVAIATDVARVEPDGPLPPDATDAPSSSGLEKQLLLWLSFDDPAAPGHDDSNQGNQVMLRGLDAKTASVPGRFGSALEFTANGYLRVEGGGSINLVGEQVTIAAWIFRAEQKPGVIVSRRATAGARELYRVEIGSDNQLRLLLNDRPGVRLDVRSTAKLPVARWTHVAVTSDRSDVRLYVDGQPASAVPYGVPIAPDVSPLLIGAASGETATAQPTGYWPGRLDDVLVYGRALTDPEIAAIAAGAHPPADTIIR